MLTGAVAVTAGEAHTCALINTGSVSCWGASNNGQLGRGTFLDENVAGSVVGLTNATSVVAGGSFTCANRATGLPVCWGDNFYGQLGNGVFLPPPPVEGDPPPEPRLANTPQAVISLTAVSSITSGGEHACGIAGAGAAACWGRNSSGQLGDGTAVNNSTPQAVVGLIGLAQIVAGDDHTCALRTNGAALCWGDNSSGQLGTGDNVASLEPVSVTAL
ncbi:MAG: hypothetical protein F2744_10955 [Actinobacteria bacterium]|uniref:Unannotated protein n=1 Tax=freshwater metagenome TaxID=449393 RepID=A0A6J7A2H0_9ZZZZ|nr:hypothetical protein [Actinomycetota bacterium]